MNNYYKLFIKSMIHNNKFKNLLLIIFILVTLFISVSFIKFSIQDDIDIYINQDINKEIYLHDKAKINFNYEKIIYNFSEEFIDNNKSYFIISDSFDEYEYKIIINKYTSSDILNKKYNLMINFDITYDNSLPNNQIIINQKISKLIYDTFDYGKSFEHTLVLNSYKDINYVKDVLDKELISYDCKIDMNKYNEYLNLLKLIDIIFIFVRIILIIIISILIINLLKEQRKFILILKSVGYSKTKIIKLFCFYIIVLILFCLIIDLIIVKIITIFLCYNFYDYFFTILLQIFDYLLIILIEIILLNKYC